jgi:hypothetical protein
MSDAASPCPDADPAGTPAPPTAESQLAGIRALVQIAELQAQAYAQDAGAAGSPQGEEALAGPAASAPAPRAAAVPRQATASAPESSTVNERA